MAETQRLYRDEIVQLGAVRLKVTWQVEHLRLLCSVTLRILSTGMSEEKIAALTKMDAVSELPKLCRHGMHTWEGRTLINCINEKYIVLLMCQYTYSITLPFIH